MKKRKKKYFSRKFQVVHGQHLLFFKHFLFLALLSFGGITLLYGLKNYRPLKLDKPFTHKEASDLKGLRVKILNASGEPDLPYLLAEKLRRNNIIPFIERAAGQNVNSRTVIIHRSGKFSYIKGLSEYIDCDTIMTKLDQNDSVEAIIIVGKDLRTLRK